MRQATLIYNPLAGPSNLAATVARVAGLWRQRGWGVTVCPTRAAGHATELAREAAVAGHGLVLAAGGDGTLGEVANGLAETEVVMAPLPVGTANSFARELRLPLPTRSNPQRLLQAADALLAGRVQRLDMGYVQQGGSNGRYWLLWAGAGADGFLVNTIEPRPQWSKKLGKLGYLLQALGVAHRVPRMRAKVTVDGRSYDDEFALVLLSNCRLYAGGQLLLAPQARLDDGLLEVWLFRGRGLVQLLAHSWRVWQGRHLACAEVVRVSGRSVSIHADPPVFCHTDGEPIGYTPLECRLKPRALRLLVPAAAPADLFSLPGETL